MRLVFAIFAVFFIQACGGSSEPSTNQPTIEQQPTTETTTPSSTTSSQYTCGNSDHPSVGKLAVLMSHSHDVAGQVLVKDNCTLEVTSFSYDGEGPSVYFYGGKGGRYATSDGGFAIGEALNGKVFNNETFDMQLASPVALDNMDSISVWCDDFNVSFGDGEFI